MSGAGGAKGAKKVLIMAAGTGGHIFPALAVAEELTRRGCEVLWLGSGRALECRLLSGTGYPLHSVRARGYFGKGLWGRVQSLFNNAIALCQCLWLLWRKRPDVAVGFGGYICVSGGMAAALLGVPLLLHEQNAIAGRANRLHARRARALFEGMRGAFADCEHALFSGNPVRDAIAALEPPGERYRARAEAPLRVLILGGSQGAGEINEHLPGALSRLNTGLDIRHQCGERNVERVRWRYAQQQLQAQVEGFIDDMPAAYGWADLVVARSGALTLSELAAAGVAALLLPYGGAVDNHQLRNAEAFAPPVVIVQQSAQLDGALRDLLASRQHLCKLAEAMRTHAAPNAAQSIAKKVCEVLA